MIEIAVDYSGALKKNKKQNKTKNKDDTKFPKTKHVNIFQREYFEEKKK